jgi:two-component system CheB/CheR fusion protein
MAHTQVQGDLAPAENQSGVAPHLVVIGSSAGGIEALSTIVHSLPIDFPAPIVVAQHLDPTRPSLLQEILARHSTLPVRLVDKRAALQPGCVYVVPANQDVEIVDGWMSLKPGGTAAKPSVDRLFSSAAAVFGQNLVAVVLTGTGSDGAVGARAVHEAGGTVVIQNPETAAFPGMARSLAPGIVDAVAELDELGPILHTIVTGSYVARLPEHERELRELLEEVRLHRRLDFSRYQRPTILRRLQRRLAATHSKSLAVYRRYLSEHPDEEERLVGSLLINVTDLVRDTQMFSYLGDHVLPTLLESARERHGELRLWSAGCATGEEAYSLAILAHEVLGKQERDHIRARIFATDVDADAIAFARRGVYPARSLTNLPPDLVARAFTEADREYEVIKPVRDLVIFGDHDLGRTAPFRQTDLVLCRNVLMYFTLELQKRTLEAFAFSLREGGFLVLGNAESTRTVGDYFTADQAQLNVYRRNCKRIALSGLGGRPSLLPPTTRGQAALAPADHEVRSVLILPAVARRPVLDELLQRIPVGIVIVTRQYDIELINSTARKLLGIHGLAVGQDLLHLLASISTAALQDAIDAAFKGEQLATLEEVATAEMGLGERTYLQIICVPRREPPANATTTVMVIVNDITAIVNKYHAVAQARSRADDELLHLRGLMEKLGETNHKLLLENEALASAELAQRNLNEAYVVASAQAEAATQELETYNEELQATNEEMETLNEELKAANEELTLANHDLDARSSDLAIQRAASEEARTELSAILAAIPDALAVIDRSGTVVRKNLAYDALLLTVGGHLTPADESGEPLPLNATPHTRAARGESFTMVFTLSLTDGETHRFQAVALPIRANHVNGGLLMLHDITELEHHVIAYKLVTHPAGCGGNVGEASHSTSGHLPIGACRSSYSAWRIGTGGTAGYASCARRAWW